MAKFNEMSKEKLAEITRAGAAASAEAKREKHKFHAAWLTVSDFPLRDDVASYLSARGCSVKEMCRAVAIVERLVDKALSGDVQAAALLHKISGEEKTTVRHEISDEQTFGSVEEAQAFIDEIMKK